MLYQLIYSSFSVVNDQRSLSKELNNLYVSKSSSIFLIGIPKPFANETKSSLVSIFKLANSEYNKLALTEPKSI